MIGYVIVVAIMALALVGVIVAGAALGGDSSNSVDR